MPIDPIGEIPIIITGDDSDLKKALQDAQDSAKAAGDKIAATFTESAQSGSRGLIDLEGSIANLKNSTASAGAALEGFGGNVQQFVTNPLGAASEQASQFVASMGTVGVAVGALGIAFGAAASQITSLVLSEGQAAEKTQNLADRLNLSVDQTQKFKEMADVAGVSLGVLTRTSMRLAEAIDDSAGSGKKVAEALDGMGIAASNSGDLLVKVLEHLAAIPDATQRIAEAHKIMGRGAVELEPLLKNYAALSEAVDSLGGRLDSELLNRLAKADDAADLLGIAWGHLKENLAAAFAPSVTAGLEMLTRLFAGQPTLTLDQQIAKVRGEIDDLTASANRASIGVTSMMGGGFTSLPGTTSQITQKQSELDLLEGKQTAQQWSKDYNDAVDASNRAAEKFKQAQTAALKDMQDALVGFNNSVVAFYNTFPATYEQYVQRLQDGGKTAKSMLGEIESDILRAQSLMVGMSGAPLRSMEQWVTALENLKTTTKSWVALDTAQKFDDLARKFETAEMKFRGLADVKLAESPYPKQWFTDTHELLALLDKLQTAVMKFEEQEQGKAAVKATLALPAVQDVIDLEAALKHFGLTREQDVATTLKQNAEIQASNILTAREKFEAESKTITEIKKMRDDEMQGRLVNEIRWKELSGADATQEIIDLEKVRIKMQELYDSTHLLGDLYIKLYDDFGKAFDRLGKGIADNIIDGKNWHEVWQGIIKDIAKMFLEDIVGTAFKALKDSIEETTGLFSKMAGVITKGVGAAIHTLPGGGGGFAGGLPGGKAGGATGGSGEVASEGGSLPGGQPGDFGGEVTGGTTGGTNSSTSGGGLSSLSSITSLASLGVSIASGITQGIQNSRMINLLGEIEISTRQTKEQLTGGIQTSLNTYLPQLLHLTDIWSALVNGHLAQIKDILWWGVLNVNVANLGLDGGANPLGSADFSWSQGQRNASNAALNAGTSGPPDQSGVNPVTARDPRSNSLGHTLGTLPRVQPVPLAVGIDPTGGYKLQPGEFFFDPSLQPALNIPLTKAQEIEQGAALYNMTPEEFKRMAESKTGPYATSTPGNTYDPYAGYVRAVNTTPLSTDPNIAAKQLADDQTTNDFKNGLIDLTTYLRRFAESAHILSDQLPVNYGQPSQIINSGHPILQAPNSGTAVPLSGTFSADQISSLTSQYAATVSASNASAMAAYGGQGFSAISHQQYVDGVAQWYASTFHGQGATDDQLQAVLTQTHSQSSVADVRAALSESTARLSNPSLTISRSYAAAPMDVAGMTATYNQRISTAGMDFNTVGQRPGEGWSTYNVNVNALDLKATSVTNAISRNLTAAGIKTK